MSLASLLHRVALLHQWTEMGLLFGAIAPPPRQERSCVALVSRKIKERMRRGSAPRNLRAFPPTIPSIGLVLGGHCVLKSIVPSCPKAALN